MDSAAAHDRHHSGLHERPARLSRDVAAYHCGPRGGGAGLGQTAFHVAVLYGLPQHFGYAY